MPGLVRKAPSNQATHRIPSGSIRFRWYTCGHVIFMSHVFHRDRVISTFARTCSTCCLQRGRSTTRNKRGYQMSHPAQLHVSYYLFHQYFTTERMLENMGHQISHPRRTAVCWIFSWVWSNLRGWSVHVFPLSLLDASIRPASQPSPPPYFTIPWHEMRWHDIHDMTWDEMTLHTWHHMTWHDMTWHDWHDMTRHRYIHPCIQTMYVHIDSQTDQLYYILEVDDFDPAPLERSKKSMNPETPKTANLLVASGIRTW